MLDKVKEGVLFMKTHELEKELGIMKKKGSLHHKGMKMVIVVIAKMIYKNLSW